MSDFCRSCRAPVMWLDNAKTGKRAPIDRDPVPTGNIVVLGGGQYQTLGTAERVEAAAEGVALHLNHFITCPQSAAWKARAARAARP
jgi:hypothetical protein